LACDANCARRRVRPPAPSRPARAGGVERPVSVLGPKGERLAWSDTNTAGRREAALVPAASPGRYFADVTSQASARGPYSVAVADAHAPALFDAEQWRSFDGVTYLRDLKLADITGDGRKDVVSAVTDKLMLLPQLASGGFG